MKKTKSLIIKLSPYVHKELKAICVDAGMTMLDVIEILIKKFLKIEKKQ